MGTTLRFYRPVVFLLLLTAVFLPRPAWGQAAERIGTTLLVEGSAEVQSQGSAVWEPLSFRAPILVNDRIRTGVASKAKILLRDDAIMTLAEHSEMQFTEFLLAPQQRRSLVTLVVGTLRVVTTRLFGAGSVSEVRTANTVAGVRGTTFIVIFISPDTTEVISVEGVVTVRHADERITAIQPVPRNFRTRVVGSAPPSQAVQVPIETMQRLSQEVHALEQSPKEVLTSEQMNALDTLLESARVPIGDTSVPQTLSVAIPLPIQPAPTPRVVYEQPAPEISIGSSVQRQSITPDISVALSQVRVRLMFPGR